MIQSHKEFASLKACAKFTYTICHRFLIGLLKLIILIDSYHSIVADNCYQIGGVGEEATALSGLLFISIIVATDKAM